MSHQNIIRLMTNKTKYHSSQETVRIPLAHVLGSLIHHLLSIKHVRIPWRRDKRSWCEFNPLLSWKERDRKGKLSCTSCDHNSCWLFLTSWVSSWVSSCDSYYSYYLFFSHDLVFWITGWSARRYENCMMLLFMCALLECNYMTTTSWWCNSLSLSFHSLFSLLFSLLDSLDSMSSPFIL